ncbi:MAG: TetR/AcrR family transcriptional regulator [Chloroflexota bacterium]
MPVHLRRSRGRPSGPEASPALTRRRILDAALAVFGERGYHGAAVDDIATRAEASKGTFYFHFPNKQAIFMALADDAARRVAEAIERSVADRPDPLARADAALRSVLELFARHRTLAHLLLVDLVNLGGGFGAKLVEIHQHFATLIQRHLDQAVADGAIDPIDTELAAYVWLGAVNEIVVRWLHTGRPDPLESAVPTLRSLMLRSLGAPATETAVPTSRS